MSSVLPDLKPLADGIDKEW